MAAKASALLLYNYESGLKGISTLDNVTFPVMFLTHQAGQLLKDLATVDPVIVRVTCSSQTTCKLNIVTNPTIFKHLFDSIILLVTKNVA